MNVELTSRTAGTALLAVAIAACTAIPTTDQSQPIGTPPAEQPTAAPTGLVATPPAEQPTGQLTALPTASGATTPPGPTPP